MTGIALTPIEVVACVAGHTDAVVSVAVIAVGRGAGQAGRGLSTVGNGTGLAGCDCSLADIAVQGLTGVALIVDELVPIVAGETLTSGGVGLTADHVAEGTGACNVGVVALG